MKGGLVLGITAFTLEITLFLLVMVLPMQFQIRDISGKMKELLPS